MTDEIPRTDPDAALRLPARFRGVDPVRPAPMRETAQERAEREAMARKHRHDRYQRRLPKRYATARLADLHPIEQNPEGRVSGWLASPHQTLLLASTEPGLGKTHAAYAVGTQAVEQGLIVEAWTAMDLLASLRPNQREPGLPDAVLDDVLTCDLMILDDLGRERTNDWTTEQIHRILSDRLIHGRRTIITTNLTAPEIADRYTTPLYDRIRDDAVIVKVTGTSRRKVADW